MAVGSIFIHETDPGKFEDLVDIDDLSAFETLELDVMNTLDFQEIADEQMAEWVETEPIIFDEEGGVALFKVEPAGLVALANVEEGMDEHATRDLKSLKAFIERHGTDHIYELATF